MPTNATRAEIARLFGRAAFGASAEQLQIWSQRPYADAVYALVDVPPPPRKDDDFFGEVRRESIQILGNGETAPQWWLERMRSTPYPLEERMTLFWHNHFATAFREGDKPDYFMLMQQNQTLRTHALGNFRNLLAAMDVDEAMLHWLNGAQSAPPKPNENYAREFFELFTLGKSPQMYSETDIREAARVFTGWSPNGTNGNFNANRHDHGKKFVLGNTIVDWGADEHYELNRITLAQPVAFALHRLEARRQPRLSASALQPADPP